MSAVMNDPIWDRVRELCKGHNPYFNAAAVYDLVKAAWGMGFDIVPDPKGPEKLSAAYAEMAKQFRNAVQPTGDT